MDELIPKEELEELKKIKGEVRGVALRDDAEFIFCNKGEEGIRKLEEAMACFGYPIKYKEVRTMDFYPLSMDAVNLVLIQKLFDFDNKKIQELGSFLARASFILRLFMKYFGSLATVAKEAPRMWRKNYTIGDLEVKDFDEKKKYAIIRLREFRLHPLYCQVFTGYFTNVLQMILKRKPLCEETKCMFGGDEYHEFLLKW